MIAPGRKDAMGQFGRITRVDDLPSDAVMLGYVRKAAELNESGVKVARPVKHPKKEIRMPKDLAAALKKNAKARATYECFRPSYKRDYLEWISEAETDGTRNKRPANGIGWNGEGKPRMWPLIKKVTRIARKPGESG